MIVSVGIDHLYTWLDLFYTAWVKKKKHHVYDQSFGLAC